MEGGDDSDNPSPDDGCGPHGGCQDRLSAEEVGAKLRRVAAKQRLKNPPFGFRISDDGETVVPIGHRDWPVRPFEPLCSIFRDPDVELEGLAKQCVPNFDPATNALSWPLLKELVLHSGRPLDHVERMSLDDIKPFLLHHLAAKRTKVARDSSRQGLRKRLTKIDVEEMVMLLYKRRPAATRLSARDLVPLIKEEFKTLVSYRTIGETDVYNENRAVIKRLIREFGRKFVASAFEAGLTISESKPGRGDKRKGGDAKHEALVRKFLRGHDEVTTAAERRVAEERARQQVGNGKKKSPKVSLPKENFFNE